MHLRQVLQPQNLNLYIKESKTMAMINGTVSNDTPIGTSKADTPSVLDVDDLLGGLRDLLSGENFDLDSFGLPSDANVVAGGGGNPIIVIHLENINNVNQTITVSNRGLNAGRGQFVGNFANTNQQNEINILVGREGAENLLGGLAANVPTGSNGNNVLTGGLSGNIMNPVDFTGTFTLLGGTGSDDLTGGTGNDTLDGGNGKDVLHGGLGDDDMNGEVGNDIVFGDDGDDGINGGVGNDQLRGGNGNDFLNGEENKDRLIGGKGNDILVGGFGNDKLTGGTGNDIFKFDTSNQGVDTLTDFSVVNDTIHVSASDFGGGLTAGATITVDQFRLGSSAQDASDRFIYNRQTGSLYFDVDGTGATEKTQLAKLAASPAITNIDIFAVEIICCLCSLPFQRGLILMTFNRAEAIARTCLERMDLLLGRQSSAEFHHS